MLNWTKLNIWIPRIVNKVNTQYSNM